MNSIESRLRRLLGRAPQSYWDEKISSKPGYWGERAIAQLAFAQEMSKVNDFQYEKTIDTALAYLEERLTAEGVITEQTTQQVENRLSELEAEAKSYTIHCAAHAHIDMNWMWSWDETVAVVLDTLRTMLNLMKEYPEFIYSQSQAAIYRIVEQFAPDMLQEIKQRIKEGRWEVTASHWVEADKNMPNGESMARHLLYTKQYLSKLLELDADSLKIDFEPDTFGHSIHVPEILASGGVRYYYHCRGHDEHMLYRWQAPSGNSVIVYREPTWYNDSAQPMLASYVPDICRQTGLKTYLNVYGVGDHGGGPTRRDLERYRDMQRWPIYPIIQFGTFADYFQAAESIKEQLPVVQGELNGVFAGCYTSQSRIKLANRIGEAILNEAEMFSAAAASETGASYPRAAYEEAWRNVLFNQFHDILPGSGVIATREHALGLFQQTMALANTNRKLALEQIAAAIDTSQLYSPECSDQWTVSEGAGVGFGAEQFKISQVERGFGSTRIVHFFNASAYDREEVTEVILWDWNCPNEALVVRDGSGEETMHQVLDQGFHTYWGHHYIRLLVWAKVPACGYSTYTVSEGAGSIRPFLPTDPRVDRAESFVLENEQLRAVFHPGEATIVSLLHKPSGEQLIDPERPAGIFRLIQEDPAKGMTAWWVGRYMDIQHLHKGVKVRRAAWGEARQALQYQLAFGRSSLSVTVSLDYNSSCLNFQLECDWQEIGKQEESIPQLNFHWPLAYQAADYVYDVPCGTIARPAGDMDVPGNSWAYGRRPDADKPSIMIVTDSKHGFRGGSDQSISVSLIRSSFDPDPYPELGNHHRISMAICIVHGSSAMNRHIETAYRCNHPINVLSGTAHSGSMPLTGSFLRLVDGDVTISAVKMPEAATGKQWIIRAYDTEGQGSTAVVDCFRKVESAYFVDTLERPLPDQASVKIEGTCIAFPVAAFSVAAICIVFA